MAHNSSDSISTIPTGIPGRGLVRLFKHSTSSLFKALKVKRSEDAQSQNDALVIENPAEQRKVDVKGIAIVDVPPADMRSHSSNDLADDLAMLAAQNKAFKEGLLQLQTLNLDEDLFIEAAEALRSKYYGRRNPILKRYQTFQDVIYDTQGTSNAE